MQKKRTISHEDHNYNLEVVLDGQALSFFLTANNFEAKCTFSKKVIIYDELSEVVRNKVDTIEELFDVFGSTDNFVVEPEQAMIIMISRNVLNNKLYEQRIPLQLITSPAQNISLDVSELKQRTTILEEKLNQQVQPRLPELEEQLKSMEERIKKIISELGEANQNPQKWEPEVSEVMEASNVESMNMSIQSEARKYKDNYDQQMRLFEEEMKEFKESAKLKLQTISKGKIKWKYQNTDGLKCDGSYEGQLRLGKPNGLGVWTDDEGNWKIQGQWRDGKLHGKTIQQSQDGDEIMYKKKGGKLDGKFIWYTSNGTRKEEEWKNGRYHGRMRIYTENGDISEESTYLFGRKKKNRLTESMAF